MRVFLTGGTGFIGSALVRALAARGDECVVLSRGGRTRWPDLPVTIVEGDPTRPGAWQDRVQGAAAVINLAGEVIVDPPKRWTRGRKRRLWDSRVATTEQLVAAILRSRPRPAVLLSGSAIGYYGGRGDDLVDESAPAGQDFLAQLAAAWERAALAVSGDTRVTLLRTGIVLGRGGGALAPLLSVFRLGLGGPWGDGRQWWSWIHLADAVGLVLLALDRDLAGPLNLTAPNPVTVNQFAAALGNALGRPAAIRVPTMVVRAALGEAADALLNLQRVVPKRAGAAGYTFQFPELEGALREITG